MGKIPMFYERLLSREDLLETFCVNTKCKGNWEESDNHKFV